jgi:hypothetical protein
MTARCRYDEGVILSFPKVCGSQRSPRRRRDMLLQAARHAHDVRQAFAPGSELSAPERPSQRLRRILTSNPRARHFSVRRIIAALGDSPQSSTLALFSAAGVFDAPDVGHLSGVMTGALGAQLAFRRREVALPRAVLKRKIPRSSLAALIGAVANLLESAEALVQPRWDWVFHPGMGVALGLLLFLLGVASMIPFLGLTAHHAASVFLMSIGLAERDGLTVMIGAVAGIATLAVAVTTAMSGKQIWATTKRWLVHCFERLRLHAAAWLLDRIEKGLGELLRIGWSNLLLLLVAGFAGRFDASAGGNGERSLKARARRIRVAESLRLMESKRRSDGA